jgi:molybdopterin synthase catalytic subunit
VSATVVMAHVGPEPIDPTQVLARVGGDADGAAILFIGTVRDHNEGRPVRGVFYEAYEEMATKVLAEVASEACAKMDGGQIAVVHRVGELAIGELSVAIAVSSPHRGAAYDASRYVIEEIKKRLPVWKHERYVDGDARWLEGSDPTAAAKHAVSQADGDADEESVLSRAPEKATR